MDKLVTIELLGQEYTLRTSAEEDQVRAAADLIRHKMEEYRSATRTNVKLNVALLTALDIANEYLRLKDSETSLRRKVEARSRELIAAIEDRL